MLPANPKSRNRTQLIWPAAGLVIAILAVNVAAANPRYTPHISLWTGVAAWCVAMVLVLILSANRIGARAGILMAGLFLAVPCFVRSPPLFRGVLMCGMLMPFAAAAAFVLTPPITGIRARLAYLCSWCGTHPVNRRARGFDAASLMQLIVATAVLDAAIASIIAVPASGLWLPVRWLAGGIMMLAVAEMITASFPLVATAFGLTVPPLMQSPWRSASVGEFWTKRWNIFAADKLFRPYCFAPLARHNLALALFAAFALSGFGHMLAAFVALGSWRLALPFGAFFLVQPLPIIAERRLGVRRWHPAAARTWTFAALAITSPLFVEPLLQTVERSWGTQTSALPPTVFTLCSILVFSAIVALASLASCSASAQSMPPNTAPRRTAPAPSILD
jgi:hypothetical protein